jgi:hypothetical protein
MMMQGFEIRSQISAGISNIAGTLAGPDPKSEISADI